MTNIPTTLTPDELAEAIALTPGKTMTLVRAFHPELPPGNTRRAPSRDRPGCFGFDTLWCGIWGPSHDRWAPLGQPGDVLLGLESFYIDHYTYEDGPLPVAQPDDVGPPPADAPLYFRADGVCCQQIAECCCSEVGPVPWRPASEMPSWAARIRLTVLSAEPRLADGTWVAEAEVQKVKS